MARQSAQPEPEHDDGKQKPGLNFRHIGKALRWLRSQRSQKQRDLADSAGITPAMLSAYETGKHRPSLDTVDRLLRALGCDVYDLTRALQVVTEHGPGHGGALGIYAAGQASSGYFASGHVRSGSASSPGQASSAQGPAAQGDGGPGPGSAGRAGSAAAGSPGRPLHSVPARPMTPNQAAALGEPSGVSIQPSEEEVVESLVPGLLQLIRFLKSGSDAG